MDKIEEIFERYGIEDKSYVQSREYLDFRKQAMKSKGFYEKACGFSEFLGIGPDKKSLEKLKESIKLTHLQVKPVGVVSLGLLVLLFSIGFGILLGFLLGSLKENPESFLEKINFLMIALWLVVGVISYVYISNYPNYLANKWRLKAGNQMVMCILYVVMYMRHTSNLEHALRFASEHVEEPLNLDIMKVLWDVETGKYSNVSKSLDNYLEIWKDEEEFVEAFHLIEGSLFEVEEDRRLELLNKALDVMVNGTYEKMLHFAHDLKNPITMLHMLGIVLPILGLVIFPLVGSFMGGLIKWYHLGVLYNILLPIFVMWMGNSVLSKRPTGYGEKEIKKEFELDKRKAITVGLFLGVLILLIGLSPIILHSLYPDNLYFIDLFDYKCTDKCNGPFGLVPVILSLFLPLSIAFGLGSYFKLKTKDSIKVRENTKKLEREFGSSLFQLGNRVEDGLPVELAIGKVAEEKRNTETGRFFSGVNSNLRFGMDVERAIFDRERGAILNFPSGLIESSMRVMVETSRKGYSVVSRALISISEYMKSIRKVNERLKDLLADVVTSMKGQISFLTPVIAGIVVAISFLISEVIGKLSGIGDVSGFGGEVPIVGGALSELPFNIGDVIPPYFFQLVVGLYVVQVIIILTILSGRIENGADNLTVEYRLGKNLFRSTVLYCIVSLIGILVFKGVGSSILGGIG